MHVLIVEDDRELASSLKHIMESAIGVTDAFATIAEAEAALIAHPFDLVIIDRRLPDGDGLSLLPVLRRLRPRPATLVLTALDDPFDIASALDKGADEYVGKPFEPTELVARARAVLRRTQARGVSHLLRLGPLEIDPQAYSVVVIGEIEAKTLDLTLTEFRLLEHMARAPRKVFSRAELLDACLPDGDALERTVDSHVSNLRRKLDAAGAADLLEGVRGVGYRLAHLP